MADRGGAGRPRLPGGPIRGLRPFIGDDPTTRGLLLAAVGLGGVFALGLVFPLLRDALDLAGSGSTAAPVPLDGRSHVVGALGVAAVVEEMAFRGWGVVLVARRWPHLGVTAVLGTSLLFALVHGLGAASLVYQGLAGGIFGAVALAGRSVVPAAAAHVAANLLWFFLL